VSKLRKNLGDDIIILKRIYFVYFKWDCMFPNITTKQRVFVSLPASVSLGERTFSVLKQVKNIYRSPMGQDRLNGFATLNINRDLARKIVCFPIIK
jgi:hypothetical protein